MPESIRLELLALPQPVPVELEVEEEVALIPLIGLTLRNIVVTTMVSQAMMLLSRSQVMIRLASTSCRLMSLIEKKHPTILSECLRDQAELQCPARESRSTSWIGAPMGTALTVKEMATNIFHTSVVEFVAAPP